MLSIPGCAVLGDDDGYDVRAERKSPETGSAHGLREVGLASFYADEFAGKQTASGEIFQPERLVAAHRSLPFGTAVRVRNLENGKSTVVRIADRGPFVPGRIIDLSVGAARLLGFIDQGVAKVELVTLGRAQP